MLAYAAMLAWKRVFQSPDLVDLPEIQPFQGDPTSLEKSSWRGSFALVAHSLIFTGFKGQFDGAMGASLGVLRWFRCNRIALPPIANAEHGRTDRLTTGVQFQNRKEITRLQLVQGDTAPLTGGY